MEQQDRIEQQPAVPVQITARAVVSQVRARLASTLGFQRREAAALALLALLVVVGASMAYVRARPASAAALTPLGTPAPVAAASEAGARLFVHVAGAVADPGVYDFAEGARVIDAVRAAGGFTSKADRAAINLARALVDGEQILVPRRGETTTAAGASSGGGGAAGSGGTVNLNGATAADLEALPGIGPVLAQRIIDYREQHGPFRSVGDLQKVSGIGPKIFASLEPLLSV